MKKSKAKSYWAGKVCGWLAYGLIGLVGLQACGDQATAQPLNTSLQTASLQDIPIPTFTALPVISESGTPTPTPIVVPATPTLLRLTSAPEPLPTATSVPTVVPATAPPPTPRPSVSLPNQGGTLQEITVQQARNFNGFQAQLPTYLPTGYRLSRLSAGQSGQPRITVLVGEYSDQAGHTFYFNIQAIGGQAASTIALPTPTRPTLLTPGQPSATPTFTPRPTVLTHEFKQETITIKGRPGLLSLDNNQSSLGWSAAGVQYFITGPLSREDIIKVAESLQ